MSDDSPTPDVGTIFGSCGHESHGYQWYMVSGGPKVVFENADGSREEPVEVRWLCLCLPCSMCEDDEVPTKVRRICRLGEPLVLALPN